MENRMIIHGTISRGVKEAFIRDKNLVLVMTDGQELVLGQVVGNDGADGVSPIVTGVIQYGGYTMVTIRDAFRDTTVAIPNGRDGVDGKSAYEVAVDNGFGGTEMQWLKSLIGAPGADGVSPTWTVEDITGGHRVTVTDKDGAKSFDVMDGKDGQGGGAGWTAAQIDLLDAVLARVAYTDADGGAYARRLIAALRGTDPVEPISISYDGTAARISGLASLTTTFDGNTAVIGG